MGECKGKCSDRSKDNGGSGMFDRKTVKKKSEKKSGGCKKC